MFRQIVTACALTAVESFAANDEASAMLAINGARTEQLQQVKELQYGSGAEQDLKHNAEEEKAARKAKREEEQAEKRAEREAERQAKKAQKEAEHQAKRAQREAEQQAKKAEKQLAREQKQAEQKAAREKKIAERQQRQQADREAKEEAQQAKRHEQALHRGISLDGSNKCSAENCRSCCAEKEGDPTSHRCDSCPYGYDWDDAKINCVFTGACPAGHTTLVKDGITHCHPPPAKEGDALPDSQHMSGGETVNKCASILMQQELHQAHGKRGSVCDASANCGACCKDDESGNTLTSHCTRCSPGYQHHHAAGTCTKCTADNCQTCATNLDQCDSCLPGYHRDHDTQKCVACSDTNKHCKACNSEGHCTECHVNYAKNTTTHGCDNKCDFHYKWEGGACVAQGDTATLVC